MGANPKSQTRVTAVLLVVLAYRMHSLSGSSKDEQAVKAVSSFQQNVLSESWEGYLALKEQFTNPWIREYEPNDFAGIESMIENWIENEFPDLLADPESTDFYTDNEYLKDLIDDVIALYDAKNGDLDDPELAAAVRDLAEQVTLTRIFLLMKWALYMLEDPAEEPTDEEIEEEIMGWLAVSEVLSNKLRLPSATVVGFMATNLTWGDVVLTEDEDGSLWHAEIPFVDEDEGSSGYYLLTFTKQNNKWKISQGLLSR